MREEADFLFWRRTGVDRSYRIRLLRGHWDCRGRNVCTLSCRESLLLFKSIPEGAVLRPKALHLGTEKLDFVGMHFRYKSVPPETM